MMMNVVLSLCKIESRPSIICTDWAKTAHSGRPINYTKQKNDSH